MSRRYYEGSALNYKVDGRENSCSAFSEIVSQYFFCVSINTQLSPVGQGVLHVLRWEDEFFLQEFFRILKG